MTRQSSHVKLIVPCCRSGLSDRDYDFIVTTLNLEGQNPSVLRDLLHDPEMRDLVLDSDALYRAVSESDEALNMSNKLHFYTLVRHGLRQAALSSRQLADYLATMLAEAVGGGDMVQLRVHRTFTHEYIASVLDTSANGTVEERFMVPVRTGNYALLISGFCRAAAPDDDDEREVARNMRYYEAVGTASFRAAAQHPLAAEFMLDDLFRQLAESFHSICTVLNRVGHLSVVHARPSGTLLTPDHLRVKTA